MSRKADTTRRKRKSIDKNVEVVISNNTYGMFVWESRNGETSIMLEGHGDEEFVSYAELRHLKKYLASMKLIITEVNDDDVSIMDIARGLRIDKVYADFFDFVEGVDGEDEETIDIEDIEDFVLNSDIDDFTEAMKTDLAKTMIDTSVELYREHKLGDHQKTRLIQKTRPEEERGDFWADIDASED